ncbi:MAG: hypothetical protein Q7U38_10105 [Methylobacter sp.]|nr:hypothetical protein [Methylobacter sp.]MDP2099480.1 hypothetical protein [Methylobacter sp.]MDP2429720.1 hypothetical protein [Methylobacter sp.]MDP3054358.1 hypothetical protein [Methylobacter sp.]MDP3360994.1 hypothetical protein [Methylobacter sp.]
MQTLNKAGLVVLTLVTGCAEWNSHPVVVEQNFGNAVRNMVKQQTLYPEHGQDDKPVLTLDGRKAEGVIRAYREGASERLEQGKEGVTFDPGVVGR